MANLVKWLLLLILGIGSLPAWGQTYSTIQGGPWSEPSTWADGVVPGPNDDVVLVGPVTVKGQIFCRNLTIQAGGSLRANSNVEPYMVTVSQDLWNKGEIDGKNWLFPLQFTVGRNLFNDGVWKSYAVHFSDTLTHLIRSGPGTLFSPSKILGDSATFESDADLVLDSLIFQARKLILRENHSTFQPTTVYLRSNTRLKVGEIVGQGNAIHGDSSSTISPGYGSGSSNVVPTFSNIHFKGVINLSTSIVVNDSLVIEDTLKIIDIQHNFNLFSVIVNGHVKNLGAILPNFVDERLLFEVSGNIENYGYWNVYSLELTSSNTQIFKMDVTQPFICKDLYAREETVSSASSIRFDGPGMMRLKKLVLQNDHSLYLKSGANLKVDSLLANGNALHGEGNTMLSNESSFGLPTFENLVVRDTVRLSNTGTFEFTGNLIIEGVLTPFSQTYYDPTVLVRGSIKNVGEIQRNGYNFIYFEIEGDLENAGVWDSGDVRMVGKSDQRVVLTDTAGFVAKLEVRSDRLGNSYLWLKNGSPLTSGGNVAGISSSRLRFADITAGEFGVYQCQVDSAGETYYSRQVTIDDGVTGMADEEGSLVLRMPSRFQLLQNYPNPFNPVTTIRYQLPKGESVRLTLYDALGRIVKRLVNKQQPAGSYEVVLDARDLSSGIYFYILEAGSFTAVRKLILQK